MKTIRCDAADIPIVFEGDVAVLGGGTAGSIAAIAAARQGMKTILVERFGTLGGNATTNLNGVHANYFLSRTNERILAGLPRELMDRVHKAGGLRNVQSADEALYGSSRQKGGYINTDCPILALTLSEMCIEAGVKQLLQTHFSHILFDDDGQPMGMVVVNKSGRTAILAKVFIDASGDADFAFAAGAPCQSLKEMKEEWVGKTVSPDMPEMAPRAAGKPIGMPPKLKALLGDTPQPRFGTDAWGLVAMLGGVDFERFMEALLQQKPWEPWPEYDQWLADVTGYSIDDVHRSWYNTFCDPLQCRQIVPRSPDDKQLFSPEKMVMIKERWQKERYGHSTWNIWRKEIKEGTENGEFELFHAVPGYGAFTSGSDGFGFGPWGEGIAMLNACCAVSGFDGTNGEHVSMAEIAGRIFIEKMVRFMRKYLPGFENAYVMKFGEQFVPRGARMIDGEKSAASVYDSVTETPDDTIYLLGSYDLKFEKPKRIPYGILVPKKVDNLLVVGKCASGAVCIRSQPSCMAMGEAAGVASAIMVETNKTNRTIDVSELQRRLKTQGVIL